ncbi:hypothetical protein PIROE2DRAFT_3813 [Piromyces sp. E2]|nr:hypothetical protein PIROE2DRAFT_3813 [Piromyces sp. E2]|eukprot:OUM68514.1 hypothetical protein PIROE2DRAFT_3813 [Piromyces sp. E2]
MTQNTTEISKERRDSNNEQKIGSRKEKRKSRRQLLLNKKLITLLIQNKSEDIICQFIETSGVDINFYNNEYNPLFHLLIIYNKTKKPIFKYVKILNNYGVNYNVILENGQVLLFYFLKIDYIECLQILKLAKESGANMYQLDNKKRNLLMYAIKVNAHLLIIQYLLSLKYNLSSQDINGNTVYIYATLYHKISTYGEVLPFLLKNFTYESNIIVTLILMGKNKQPVSKQDIINTIKNNNELINIKNNEGDNAFFIAIKNHYHLNILLDFVYLGSRIDEVDKNGLNPLMIAMKNGNFKAFSFLMHFYTDFNYKNKNNDTVLTIAAKMNDFKIVSLLLNFSEIKDAYQISETKKNYFIHNFWSEVLEELNLENEKNIDSVCFESTNCKKSLKINEQNNDGETALTYAIKNENKAMVYNLLIYVQTNNVDIAELILNIQDEVNEVDENHHTAIYIAAKNKNLNIVNKLLEKNVDITISDNDFNTPLMVAVCKDYNINIVKALLSQSDNTISNINKNGKTAFLLSIENNCPLLAKLLLESGASVSNIDTDSKKNNALLLASKHGNYEIIKYLIENNYINIDSQNGNLNTALIKASKKNNLEIVKYLSRNKANLEIKNNKGNTALIVACLQKNYDIIKCLLDYGANINNYNNEGVTPIIVACQNNDFSLVNMLITEYNAIINYSDPFLIEKKEECFIQAVEKGYYKIVKFLLKQGYKINIDDRNNTFFKLLSALIYDTNNSYYRILEVILPHPYFKEILKEFRHTSVLIPACRSMKKKTIDLLLKYEIDVNVRDNHNNTALIEAASHPFLYNYVKEFIHRKAELNVINEDGISALLNSCKESDNKIFKYLVNKGANIYITDLYGNNALMHACSYDDIYKIKFLLKKHINIDAQNNDGDTALMQSVKSGKVNIVKYLLNRNANVNILNSKNQNALVIAILSVYEKEVVEYKDLSIIKMLMAKKTDPNIPVDANGNSILMYLIMKNDISMIKYLAKIYFDTLDFSHKNHLGHNAFAYALKCNNYQIADFLISTNKINVFEEDDYGNDMIMYSICSTKLYYFNNFIKNLHVDVNHQECKGNTALHYAARLGNTTTIEKLIKNQANLEIQNYQQETPLMVACRYEQKEAMKVLLENGAFSLFIDNAIYSDQKSFDFKQNQDTHIDLMIDYYKSISGFVPENYLSSVSLLQRMKKFYEPVTLKDRFDSVEEVIKEGIGDFFELCIDSFTNAR